MASGGLHETLAHMLRNRTGDNAAGTTREVEVRFGRTVDGLYVTGIEEETWDRVLERLGSYDQWSASSVELSTHVHYGASIHTVETGATSSKRRLRDVAFTAGAVTVKACESVERTCTAPRRRLTETAVRAKHRHSFSYKDKVRFDCSLCVTGSVVASRVATPRCTYEVEIEAISDDATAASIIMKVDDVIEMITGTRPTQYTRVPCT